MRKSPLPSLPSRNKTLVIVVKSYPDNWFAGPVQSCLDSLSCKYILSMTVVVNHKKKNVLKEEFYKLFCKDIRYL